ncbi:MAG: spermidine/putrescine ABC transporter substrate-binding protein [Coxiellaceae bacterium]|jgi:spermidine/putrescine transport system substrate-binding protein|nr:spermidine/putrescine ABC transporter substrate-binding protein [Coxiellaceae bacterium]
MIRYYYIAIIVHLLVISEWTYAQINILNIYIWGNYLPHEVVQQFTKETRIKVNLIEYDNNETMFAKLKALKHSGYDIVVPSSYYVERMSKQGMLLLLDKTKLPNLSHVNPILLNRAFDPKNRYSVPYIWGSTGIVINTKYIDKKKVTAWQNFWDKQYKDQLMILNDIRDVFSIGLLTLGYSINDSNPAHIKKAYLKLKQLLPNIKIFSVDTVPNIYIDEDAIIGMAWSGDCKLAQDENSNLEYIYPKEGFSLWIDSFVILKDAPHIESAHKFINFMLRPEIAKQIILAIGHSTANKSAIKLLPIKLQRNPVTNPPQEIMRLGKIQLDLSDKTRYLYEKYWELLKINN